MENRLSLFCDRVIEAGWLISAATIPLFFNIFSSRVFEPDKLTLLRSIVLLMAATWGIKLLASRPRDFSPSRFLRTSPLALPAIFFAIIYVVATALSVVPRTSFWGSYVRLQGLVTNLSYLTLFFLVAYHLRRREQLDRLLAVIVLTSIPISLYGVAQHLGLDPLPWGGDVVFRVTSTMGNAIFLAAYLIMVVPMTLVRLVQAAADLGRSGGKGRKGQLLVAAYAGALGLQLVTIVLTKSRGPWVGLAVGLVFLSLLWLARRGQRKLVGALGAFFAVALALVLALNIPSSPLAPVKKASVYLERLGTILDMQSGTNRVRTLIWFGDGVGKGAAGLITESPLRTLLGHGPESMYVAYNPYYPPELAHLEARNATPDRSHNDFLDYLVTMGFLGLFSYLLVMVRAFSLGLQRLWREGDLARQGLLVGILGALIAHVIESLVGIAIASTLTYTWLFLGCLAALATTLRGEASPAASPVSHEAAPEGRPRRRRDKRGVARGEATVGAGRPWFRKGGFYLLAAYIFLTFVGTILALPTLAARGLDPSALVLTGYAWLLVGMLVTAFWVERPAAVRGKVASHTLVAAAVVGVVAVFLPVKLFLGGVIGDIHFKNGQNLAAAQRFDQAASPYLKAIQWDPDQDYYYLFLGQAYLELARTSREDKAPQPLANMSDLLRFRDRSVAQLGRENLFQAALVSLKRARELNPLNTDHSSNLGRLYRAWGEISSDPTAKREKWLQSVEYYKQATSLSPNAAHLKAEWGLIYYFLGDLSEASKQYQEALRLDPFYSPAYAYLGDLFRSGGNEDAALESYRKALAVDTQGKSLLPPQEVALRATLGQIYFQRGLLRESLEENLRLVQLAPKDLAGHQNLALIYRDLGDRGKALDEARLALSLAPPEQRPSIQAFIAQMQSPSP